MMGQARRKTSNGNEPFELDYWLHGSAIALAMLGLIMIASASIAIAEKAGLHPFHYLIKHVIALGLGSLLALICTRIPMHNLERASPFFVLLSVPLLLVVFVPGLGVTVNGATRWVNLGVISFQVVELVKLMMVIFLAGYLVRQAEQLRSSFMGTLKPFAVAAAIAILLLAQPDFGGALLILATTVGMIWIGGGRWRDLFSMAVAGLPLMIWAALSESYRLRRLKSFLDPWADPYDGGFQLTQALIAIGRGEWLGVGLGGSVQKLFYLPEAHTDFILAVLAEELGLAGIVLLLTLFGLLVGRGLLLAMRALEQRQYFAGYLAYGLSLVIAMQAAISIGVNLGVLPTKGLTLPLISSGGSSALMMCLSIGLLLRIGHEVKLESPGLKPGLARKPQRSASRPSKTAGLSSI
jgi:cell division protein FtsW